MPEDKQKQTHFRIRTIIEVLGKPKEHVEKTIRGYTTKIEKDDSLILLKEEFSEAKQHDELWSVFAELEMVIKGVNNLVHFCFEYMPSSLEILKPEELKLSNREIAGFLNDLQGKLHNVDMIVKQLKNQNDFLRKNLNTMIKNTILVSLGIKKLDIEQLSKVTGIKEGELSRFIEKLIEENKIKKEGQLLNII